MNEDGFERDLAARFQRLREEDDSQAPAFRAVYEAARRKAPPRRRVFILVVAAAAVPIVVAVLMVRRPAEPVRSRPEAEANASAIAAWTSPTDSLLETPGSELYGEAPPVAEPMPRWIFESKGRASTPPALSTPTPKGVSS